MALLTRCLTSLRGFRPSWIVLLVVAVTGCVLIGDWFSEPVGFSHRLHLDVGLDCSDCHDPESGTEPVPATLDTCLVCHDDDLNADIPVERRPEAIMADMPTRPANALGDVHFAHDAHVESGGLECNTCHVGVELAETVDGSLADMKMSSCVACHQQSDQPALGAGDCVSCHAKLDKQTKPPSHLQNWMRVHGKVVRSGSSTLTADDCSLCHADQDCTSCHMDQAPANHNNVWRLRTHGVAASIDRDNCQVCHQPDSCIRCHSSVTPLSHRGSFGGTRSTHCLSCHFPVQSDNCSVCHKATPSHQLAAPKPPDHNPGMNCRQCHGVDQALPHVDNGTNCNSCHP